MNSVRPRAYARIPTFTEVLDELADGLGLVPNREDRLGALESFDMRTDVYNERVSPKTSIWLNLNAVYKTELKKPGVDSSIDTKELSPRGLEGKILEILAGSNKELKTRLSIKFSDLELDLADARSRPLITEFPLNVGFEAFITWFGMLWLAELLDEAGDDSTCVLYNIRLLVMNYQSESIDFTKLWKRELRAMIPADTKCPEFRATISKIDKKSQRKLNQIQLDIQKLEQELDIGRSNEKDHSISCKNIRTMYISGMALLRFDANADRAGIRINLLELLGVACVTQKSYTLIDGEEHREPPLNNPFYPRDKNVFEYRLDNVWTCLGHEEIPAAIQLIYQAGENLRNSACMGPLLFRLEHLYPHEKHAPFISYAKGLWYISRGEQKHAKQELGNVLSAATSRQLGSIASDSATLLLALRLSEPRKIKTMELNPLVATRISWMKIIETLNSATFPTPFSGHSEPPQIKTYELHVLQSAARLNSFEFYVGRVLTCNPLSRLFDRLAVYAEASKIIGTRLTKLERVRSIISGISVSPYDAVRDLYFYVFTIFEKPDPELTKLDSYFKICRCDQLRILRYIDDEKFKSDSAKYEIPDWLHPQDPNCVNQQCKFGRPYATCPKTISKM